MLSDVVGERIAYWRAQRRWTQDRLADECAKLGMPELTRAVIRYLETGRAVDGVRRRMITVDELVVIAYALDVTPMALVCPFPLQAEVQLLPAASPTPTYQALEWFSGGGVYVQDVPHEIDLSAYQETVYPIALLRYHELLLLLREDASLNLAEHGTVMEKATDESARYLSLQEELLVQRISTLDADLVTLRTQMRLRGYPVPGLPPAVAYLEDHTSPHDRLVSIRVTFPSNGNASAADQKIFAGDVASSVGPKADNS